MTNLDDSGAAASGARTTDRTPAAASRTLGDPVAAARLAALQRAIVDRTMRFDRDGRVLACSGGTVPLCESCAVCTRVDVPLSTCMPSAHRSVMKAAATMTPASLHTMRFSTRAGDFEARIAPVDDHEAYIVVREASETPRFERMVEASRRMEAIGVLASGVAHDFNNILSVIKTYASLIQLADGLPDGVVDDLDVILDAIGRAGELTSQLMPFAATQPPRIEALPLGKTVLGMQRILRCILPANIELTIDAEAADHGIGADKVWIDRAALSQVLVNLTVNARDAMPDGGNLWIETRAVKQEPQGRACHPGECVRLTVRDDGPGMPPDIAARAFEPFFSTKGKSGTGLGLSTVYATVNRLGGTILLETAPGEGATFHVVLPMAGEADSAETRRFSRQVSARGGTALLVGAGARSVALADTLRAAGHRVLGAADPETAFELAKAAEFSVDAVVLADVIGVPLADLVRSLRDHMPGVPVLARREHAPPPPIPVELESVDWTDGTPTEDDVARFVQRALRSTASHLSASSSDMT